MERVRCARAMRRGIGKWIDNLQLLDDRAGPPVGDDERQRILMYRANVDEMNVEPIDLGHELRQGVQLRLALAPVVICPPIARECLSRRQLHALRCIGDRFALRPLGRVYAPAQLGKLRFRHVDVEGTESKAARCGFVGVVFHNSSPLCWCMTDWSSYGEVPHLVNVSVERPDTDAYCGAGRRAQVVPAVPSLQLAQ